MSRLVVALAFVLALVPAQAQVAFRAASSATVVGLVPAFRAAASAGTTTGTLTIGAPAGVAANDVLIASIAVTPSSVPIVPPAGWMLVRRSDNAGPTSNSLAVYYKVATSEPASYAWGASGSAFSVGGVQAFSGVDTSNPISAENGQATPPSTALSTPSIGSGGGNSMLVASHAFASAQTWTPPAGWIESLDQLSPKKGATGLSIESSHRLSSDGFVTVNATAVAAGSADAGNAHILSLNPAPASLTIPTPAGVIAGDVMIAAIAFNNADSFIQHLRDWTHLKEEWNPSGIGSTLAIYGRRVVSGEPASHTWKIRGGAYLVGGIQAFSGAAAGGNPYYYSASANTPSGTSHDTPSIETQAGFMLVTAHTYASSSSWTLQSGLTEAFDQASGPPGATGQSLVGGYQMMISGGQTGAKRATAAGNADIGNTYAVTIMAPSTATTVEITSPANNSTFTAPATVTLAATAADPGGIVSVRFFKDGQHASPDLWDPPYTSTVSNLPAGTYTFTAEAFDQISRVTTSSPVTVTVQQPAALHFVHVDHLNTPRLVANAASQTVWLWHQAEPFGNNPADEDPSGLGTFDLPLRLPGQYYDKETNLHYNNNRDYDAGNGRYVESDPLGLVPDSTPLLLTSGAKLHSIPLNHLYAYVAGDPLVSVDPLGLARVKVYEVRRGVQTFFGGSIFGCDTQVGSCGKFHERFRLTWTAEASDSCVLAGFETKVVNGPTQFFGIHMEWWQVTHTWWKYKSSNNCPCELTDYRFEEKETPFPHSGPESLNRP